MTGKCRRFLIERHRLAEALNRQPSCKAVLTSKRAMENYLHYEAIREASGLRVSFGDLDDVAELAARASLEPGDFAVGVALETEPSPASRQGQEMAQPRGSRLHDARAIERRDPDDEVIGWLRTIAELVGVETERSV